MSIISLISNQGIKNASASIEDVSKRFATGERLTKPSEDLFASIQIATGREKLTYYDSALASLQRLRSVLGTRNGSLQTMKNGVEQLASLALKSSSAVSEAERNSAVTSFDQVMSRVANIATTSEYAGIKLLDGSFGGSEGFAPVGDEYINNLSVISSGALATVSSGEMHRQNTINFALKPQAGDTFTVGDKVLAFVAPDADADPSLGVIKIGDDIQTTVANAFEALSLIDSGTPLGYRYSINANSTGIVVDSLSTSKTSDPDLLVNAGGRLALAGASTIGAATTIDFGGFEGSAKMIGNIGAFSKASYVMQGKAAARAAYEAIGTSYGVVVGDLPGNVDDENACLQVSFTIGDVQFKGAIFSNVAHGGDYSKIMYCKRADLDHDPDASEFFKINLVAAENFVGAAAAENGANTTAFLAALNADATKLSVGTTRTMGVDYDGGDILDSKGDIMGSVKGMSVQLKSTEIKNNIVKSVSITNNLFKFVLVDEDGVEKTFTGTSASNTVVRRGESITCTEATTGEALIFNNGKEELDISKIENQTILARAIFSAISAHNATFIVGTDVSQTLDMKLSDMRWNVLTGGSALTLENQDSSREAATLLQNVVTQINAEIAVNAAYDLAVSSLVEQTNVSKENLTSAVESLSNVDITAEKTQLDNMMTLVRASVTAMTTDLALRRAIEEVLRG